MYIILTDGNEMQVYKFVDRDAAAEFIALHRNVCETHVFSDVQDGDACLALLQGRERNVWKTQPVSVGGIH